MHTQKIYYVYIMYENPHIIRLENHSCWNAFHKWYFLWRQKVLVTV